MKHLYPLLFFICLFPADILAQTDSTGSQRDSLQKDSLIPRANQVRIQRPRNKIDSSIFKIDSLRLKDSLLKQDSLRLVQQAAGSIQKKLAAEKSPAQDLKEGEKKFFFGKEYLFYYLVFLLILFGLLRRVFAKYFYDLFRVFFQNNIKTAPNTGTIASIPIALRIYECVFCFVCWTLCQFSS